jgi:hypothetical protein
MKSNRFEPGIPIFSAILTKSGSESAPILFMSWLRWTFTVALVVPISAAMSNKAIYVHRAKPRLGHSQRGP